MDSSMGFIGVLMLVVSMSAMVERATAKGYYVGDGYGWDVPPYNSSYFYLSWAVKYEFQVGDFVEFSWTGNHTAMEVTEAGYTTCNKSDNVNTPVGDIGLSVTLTSVGTRYFICSVGTHCEQGQKVAVNVTEASSAAIIINDFFVVMAFLALVIPCVFSY